MKCTDNMNHGNLISEVWGQGSHFSEKKKKKKEHSEPIILYPGKLAMHFESKIKIFSDIQRPALYTILSV